MRETIEKLEGLAEQYRQKGKAREAAKLERQLVRLYQLALRSNR